MRLMPSHMMAFIFQQRADEAVTAGTSNIREPQGLFMAAFHQAAVFMIPALSCSNGIVEKLGVIKRTEINPQQMTA